MRVRTGFGIAAIVLVGCRQVPVQDSAFTPPAPLPPPVLVPVAPSPLGPDPAKVPPADLQDPFEKIFPPHAAGFRGLTAKQAREESAKRAAGATAPHRSGVVGDVERYLRDDEARRAADAVEDDLYKLAELEARAEALAKSLMTFDRLKAEVEKIRKAGLPVPGGEELLRQRGKILDGAAAAEAGIMQLNVAIKARIGYPQGSPERIWPQVDLADRLIPLDGEALAAEALSTRPDLLALRAAYDGADSGLGAELLKLLGVPQLPPRFTRHTPAADTGGLKAVLYNMIVAKEAAVAAEARAKAFERAGAIRRASLAAARAASWRRQIDDLKAKGAKPAEVLAAEVESTADTAR